MSYLKKIGKSIGGKSATDRLQGAAVGAVKGYMVGGPAGAIAGGVAGGAAGKSGIDKAMEPINKQIDSITGRTAARHQQNTADRQKQKIEDQKAKLQAFGEQLNTSPEKRDIQAGQIDLSGAQQPSTQIAQGQSFIPQQQFGEAIIKGTRPIERVQTGPAAQIGQLGDFTAAQVQTDPSEQVRSSQMTLTEQLQQQAAGEGPSLAESEARKAFEQAIASQYAMAAGKGPMALRQAQRNVAALQQQAAAEAGDIRMREQMAAREQLGAQLAGVRGQDIGLATTQAELQQQAGLAGAEAETRKALEQAGMEQQTRLTQAELDQQRALTQAELDQQEAIKQAELEQEATLAQAGMSQEALIEQTRQDLQRDIEQGKISSQEAQAIYKAQVDQATDQAKLDTQVEMLAQELASKEGIVATQAQLDAMKAVLASDVQLASDLSAARTANQASNQKLFGSLIGAGATVAAAFI